MRAIEGFHSFHIVKVADDHLVLLVLWGVLATRVALRGTIGGIVWNPPRAAADLDGARRHYDGVDWALDIREARFRSVPSFRFGPPGRLVRRDQPCNRA